MRQIFQEGFDFKREAIVAILRSDDFRPVKG